MFHHFCLKIYREVNHNYLKYTNVDDSQGESIRFSEPNLADAHKITYCDQFYRWPTKPDNPHIGLRSNASPISFDVHYKAK